MFCLSHVLMMQKVIYTSIRLRKIKHNSMAMLVIQICNLVGLQNASVLDIQLVLCHVRLVFDLFKGIFKFLFWWSVFCDCDTAV